jgi:hypothetical protein
MAFLSLNLNAEEQQSFGEENPRPAETQALGNGAAESRPAAHTPGEAQVETRVSEPKNDNWPEVGLQIIQSVLREAQNKTAAVKAEGTDPASAREQEKRNAAPVPASSPTVRAREDSPLPLPREIEELRKQISLGITPSFKTAPKELSPAPETAQATAGEEAPATLQLSDASFVPQSERAWSAGSKISEAAVPPEALAAFLDEIRKKMETEKDGLPAAASDRSGKDPGLNQDSGLNKNSCLNKDAQPPPTWMSKLASGTENRVSNVAPEALSPLMDEIRKKLGGDGAFNSAISSDEMFTDVTFDKDAVASLAPAIAPERGNRSAPSFATFKFGYLPGRGLLYSIIGHEVAMFGLFLLITYVLPTFREQRLIVGSINAQDHIIYLPEVGGGEEGQKSPGGGASKPQQASAAPARASRGFSYPGAQAIMSDPPNPTNAFQTVLHPLAVRPEPLKKLVPAPNVVQMAETRLPSELIAPKATMPRMQAPLVPIRVKQDSNIRRNARWRVPVKAPQFVARAEMPKLAAAEQPLPQAPKSEPKPKPQEQAKAEQKPAPEPIKVAAEKRAQKPDKPVAPPSTAQVAKLEMHGKSLEPLLSLSPAPLPQGRVPAGEARGRFAIAPGGTLNPNSVMPGKPSGSPSQSAATGQEKSQSANAATELASNTGTGAGHNPAAGGGTGNAKASSGGGASGQGSGSGATAGAGVGGSGSGDGRGSGGNGAGRSGHGAGTGAGAGSGAGTGAFPGITIQGGEGNDGSSDSHTFTVAQQTPYQMTIVATASSGGGLADFGVFENERVYTVYIPMQRTPQEADPTWTLQYALASPSADAGDGQLIAPSPVMREWPQIDADLQRKYAQRQVVVYAILGEDGKVTHISVKQTPDAKVSDPIAQALSKWVFRPAQLNNKPVAVKLLIGIPL